MKVFLFGICFLAAAFARPDVSHVVKQSGGETISNRYQIPSTNYGVPLVKNYGVNVHSNIPSNLHSYDQHKQQVTYVKDYGVNTYPSGAHIHTRYPSDENVHSTYSSGAQVHSTYPSGAHIHTRYPSDEHVHSTYSSGAQVHSTYPSGAQVHSTYPSGAQVHSTYPSGAQVHNTYPSGAHVQNVLSTYPSTSHLHNVHSVQTRYPSDSQVTYNQQVDYAKHQELSAAGKVDEEKHVYYYSAPDVIENRPRLKVHIIPNHKKNTNVLYVKVPEYAVPIPDVVAPPSVIEEKTKVYVLVKDPKEYDPVVYNAPTPVKTSNPELYVVPYKSQQDVEKVIAGDNQGVTYGAIGQQYSDELSFVKSINTESRNVLANDKYSGFHHGDINVYAREQAPAIPGGALRFSSDSAESRLGGDHVVTSFKSGEHLGGHTVNHVVTPVVSGISSSGSHGTVEHHSTVHNSDAHHVVTPVVSGFSSVGSHGSVEHHSDANNADAHVVHHVIPNHGIEKITTHEVIAPSVSGSLEHSVHTVGLPVIKTSGIQQNTFVSDDSLRITPLNSISSTSGPSFVKYSENSVSPTYTSLGGQSFVSSTTPTVIVHNKK